MTPLEEIRAAEARMHITLTRSQVDWIEAWLEGRSVAPTGRGAGRTYAERVYDSILRARG